MEANSLPSFYGRERCRSFFEFKGRAILIKSNACALALGAGGFLAFILSIKSALGGLEGFVPRGAHQLRWQLAQTSLLLVR